MMASYSASLLEAENSSEITHSNYYPVGDCKKKPTPNPETRDAPLMWRIHYSFSLGPMS